MEEIAPTGDTGHRGKSIWNRAIAEAYDRWSAVLHRGARAVGRPRPRMMGPRVPDKQAGIPFSLPTDSCTGSGRQMVEQVPERFRFSLSQSSLLSPVRSRIASISADRLCHRRAAAAPLEPVQAREQRVIFPGQSGAGGAQPRPPAGQRSAPQRA